MTAETAPHAAPGATPKQDAKLPATTPPFTEICNRAVVLELVENLARKQVDDQNERDSMLSMACSK
jgi:hypothetical protein